MSNAEVAIHTPPTSAWHMYRAMVGVGVLCGLLIVTVYQATLPIIERNKAEALQEAIFHVLPDASRSKTFRFVENEGFVADEGEVAGAQLVHAGYDDDGSLVGFAVEAKGMGYQDVISLIYGYSPAEQAIIGIQVLESKETPGLGDKITNDPDFLANFEHLDVSLGEDQTELAHPIVPVKGGEKTHPWEVDGITGATISSVAVASILDASAGFWVPHLQRYLSKLEEGE